MAPSNSPVITSRPRRIGIGLGLMVLAAVVVLLGPGLAPASSGPAGFGFAPEESAFPTPVQHVFLIMMENEQTDLIYGKQPFQTYLANTYAWGGDANKDPGHVGYYAVCHPSAPNYLALTSGQPLQCGSDGYKSYSANNVFNVMDEHRVSWIGYAEGAPHNCDTSDNTATDYLQRHDPIHYYSDLGGSASGSVCETHDVAIANLIKDYPYSTVPPAFTYIAPNDIDDGHSSSATTGDNWLKSFVSKLVNTTWFSSSVIFITYDEAYTSAGSDNTTGYTAGGTTLTGGPVYVVSVSKFSKGIGTVDAVDDSHYNLLSTIEWLLGLPATGTGHDGTSSFPAMKGLLSFSSKKPPTTYELSGTVSNDTPVDVSGATVYANNSTSSASTTTDSDGAFSFELPNGTFELTATAPGYRPSSIYETVAGKAIAGVVLTLSALSSPPSTSYPVNGSVLDNSTSSPVASATVYANNSTGSVLTTTSSEGSFNFTLANGTYELTATAPGYAPGTTNLTVAGAGIDGVTIELVPLATSFSYSVSGTVLDNSTSDPVANATVYANNSAGSVVTATSSNGSFAFSLANGTYELTATAANYTSGTVNVSVAGAGVAGVTIGLVPNSGSSVPRTYPANGSVQDPVNDTPVANATLVFLDGSTVVRAVTNANGTFSINLPNGTYRVTVMAPGFEAKVVTVSVAGGLSAPLRIQLVPIGTKSTTSPGLRWGPTAYLLLAIGGGAGGCLGWWGLRRRTHRQPPRRPAQVAPLAAAASTSYYERGTPLAAAAASRIGGSGNRLRLRRP